MSPRRTLSLPSSRPPAVRLGTRSRFSIQLLSFHTLPNSFAFTKNSTLLFSINSKPFCKNARGGGESDFRFAIHSRLPSIFRTLFQVPYPASPLFAALTQTAGVCTQNSHSGTQPQRSSLNRRAIFFFNCKLPTVDSIRLSRAANSAVYPCTRML